MKKFLMVSAAALALGAFTADAQAWGNGWPWGGGGPWIVTVW